MTRELEQFINRNAEVRIREENPLATRLHDATANRGTFASALRPAHHTHALAITARHDLSGSIRGAIIHHQHFKALDMCRQPSQHLVECALDALGLVVGRQQNGEVAQDHGDTAMVAAKGTFRLGNAPVLSAGVGNIFHYCGSLPASHLMLHPRLGRCTALGVPPARTASNAARKSRPSTGSWLNLRAASICPRYTKRRARS